MPISSACARIRIRHNSRSVVAAQPPGRSRRAVWAVVAILAVLFAAYFFAKDQWKPCQFIFRRQTRSDHHHGRSSRISGLGARRKKFCLQQGSQRFQEDIRQSASGGTATIDCGDRRRHPAEVDARRSEHLVRSLNQLAASWSRVTYSASYEGGDIWKKDLASGKKRNFSTKPSILLFSPDGKTLAVDASWAGPRRIWAVDAQGHNRSKLPQTAPKPWITWNRTGLPTAKSSPSRMWNARNSAKK